MGVLDRYNIGRQDETFIVSGSRAAVGATATVVGTTVSNSFHNGMVFNLNVSAVGTTAPSLTFEVLHGCPGYSTLTTVGVSAAITATGTVSLVVYPGITSAAGATSTMMGSAVQANVRHGNDGTSTYALVAQLVP